MNILCRLLGSSDSRYVGRADAEPDFRYYNYCSVPYFGGSDDYLLVYKMFKILITIIFFQIYEKQEFKRETIHLTVMTF